MAACGLRCGSPVARPDADGILRGKAAFATWETVKPGVLRKITPQDLPRPQSTAVTNPPTMISRPPGVFPQSPPGFTVKIYETGLAAPRAIRIAPNGDLFAAESDAGQIRVLRGTGARADTNEIFASHLVQPFGMAFYPAGDDPHWLYVATTEAVFRFPYKSGDLKAKGAPEKIAQLVGGGHFTRDVTFSADGAHMFIAVGSLTNNGDPDTHPGESVNRAAILEFTPEGKFEKVYASGLRNPVGITIQPTTGQLWTTVSERDALGDNLVPDYITHVVENGFYGWPWYYSGTMEDPELDGKHQELKSKVLTPDVLLQAHNASLQMAFYTGQQFPAEYQGDIFAAQHGSWNRSVRTGYEIIRVLLKDGKATGVYEDFVTGFVTDADHVWGRPVGVATAKDGSLMFSDDGSGTIWRVSYIGN